MFKVRQFCFVIFNSEVIYLLPEAETFDAWPLAGSCGADETGRLFIRYFTESRKCRCTHYTFLSRYLSFCLRKVILAITIMIKMTWTIRKLLLLILLNGRMIKLAGLLLAWWSPGRQRRDCRRAEGWEGSWAQGRHCYRAQVALNSGHACGNKYSKVIQGCYPG